MRCRAARKSLSDVGERVVANLPALTFVSAALALLAMIAGALLGAEYPGDAKTRNGLLTLGPAGP
jgi:hypothetical protein